MADLHGNPCIKTGCSAVICDKFWHGDLFDFGDYYLLKCGAPGEYHDPNPDQLMVHLYADTYFTTYAKDTIIVIKKTDATFHDEPIRYGERNA